MRGRSNGSYPYGYLELISELFGYQHNTIEVCSGDLHNDSENLSIWHSTVDINPDKKADLVVDGQTLGGLPDNTFDRWRCDPPYNEKTANRMYKTKLPSPLKLLTAGARVCKPGALMFLLLGRGNYKTAIN
ncbi:MAG TPA: hypothetical protein VFJ51_09495 [Nitrososphaeraceae archaeon]|nr:hypothetical protein [Nitrososphaeraceae archaeon]